VESLEPVQEDVQGELELELVVAALANYLVRSFPRSSVPCYPACRGSSGPCDQTKVVGCEREDPDPAVATTATVGDKRVTERFQYVTLAVSIGIRLCYRRG